MKKWYKLLKDYAGLKAGDTAELDEAVGKTLVEMKVAELVPDDQVGKSMSEAIQKATGDLQKQLTDTITTTIQKAAGTIQAKANGTNIEIVVGKERQEEDPTGGFKTAGEFYQIVKSNTQPGANVTDERIKVLIGMDKKSEAKTPSGQNEGSGADGSILVPDTWAAGIWERPDDLVTWDLFSMIDGPYNLTGNTWACNRLKGDSKAAGTRNGGAMGYWVEEGKQLTGSKVGFDRMGMRLKKLAALAFVTDEQLEDSPVALEQYLNKMIGKELRYLLSQAVFEGNGASRPLGLMKCPAKITVGKESTQGSKTIVKKNIDNMYNRMYAPCRTSAVWLINQDCEPQLDDLDFGATGDATKGVTNRTPLYIPAGGYSEAPLARLKGRPVLPCDFCETLGTEGDIAFVDLSQYIMVAKAGGIKSAVSIHLRFDYDEVAYRATVRVDGQSWWPAALTGLKGTNTYSPIITLEARP